MKQRLYKTFCRLLCSLMLINGGCTLKELNDEAPTTIADQVEVLFDWSKSPTKEAQTMVLYLYSDQHDMMDYRFNNPDGGIIRTYGGPHTAVCHSNDDPYGHHLRNHHLHDEIEIYTDETAVLVGQGISTMRIPRAKGTEDEPLRDTPSMIYGTQASDVNLKVSAFLQKLQLYPEELICRYSVEFVDVENLKSADIRIDGTISSLAGGYFPGRMTPTSEAVSHTFTLTADVESNSLRSDFYTFGLPEGEELPHKLCLYVALKNRTGNFYTFDVSDQVNKAPDPRNVSIKIYGLKLPEIPDDPLPPQGEGGVSIEVDTWDTYHFDLKV
ncbi:MAG: DUF5119 domain-containing protein [Muribaculaceae bacterium]|nr:DUF5119 domain-containing protein [Muribaculaceae bacterium]MDE6522635.1 DUF5119 domain-containing protein [Muribaculaceae bacterium]